jgi:hypothetical protein
MKKPLRVLVACECTGEVRRAFRALGHSAYSCDLKPSEDNSPYHITGDVLPLLAEPWDLLIAHPPCTHLAVSGARWWKDKEVEQRKAIWFFLELANANVPHICVENPVGLMSTQWKKPDQIIQPWEHGHPHEKRTCLWLRDLPLLRPTRVVTPEPRHVTKSGRSLPPWYNLPPSPERGALRSRTFPGIARAMARQYSTYILRSSQGARKGGRS